MDRILPAYPLWIIDPLFSLWSKNDTLIGGDTMFWTGQTQRACGFVRYNGKTYRFMGYREDAQALEQTNLQISAFATEYTFRAEEFTLKVSFVSPRLPSDLDILSCPVCYTEYEVLPVGALPADFSIAIALDEDFCYADKKEWVVGGVIPLKGYEAAYFTRGRNLVLSDTSDCVTPDWGDFYLAGEESWFISESGINYYIANGKTEYLRKNFERQYVFSVNRSPKGTFLTAVDDKVSIFYFGEWLKSYYFRGGKTIIDAMNFFTRDHDVISEKCKAFDAQLKADCDRVGKDYYTLACASLRQSVGAHKLVQNAKGELLFLSKENNSNGCIGTVDVSYPSMPLFLLYNPELVSAMMNGIYAFARMPVWNYDFAPHDLGTYPWCSGQVYGTTYKDEKYGCGMYSTWAFPRTNQMLYIRPAESNVYDFDTQMPVEECGNMLIMTAAAIVAGANKDIAKKNFDLLKKWVKFLEKYGLKPANQLCTDDFAGHLANNVNLAIKALVGIESFSIICKMLGKETLAENYEKKAEKFAADLKAGVGDGIMPLAYGMENSYSIKYNILFDKLFGFELIGQDVCERETAYYIEKSNRYGVPLDTRETYTKSDWILWASALTDDKEKREKLYQPVVRYLKETPSRVPFCDWYQTKLGEKMHFFNRTVQGGIFAPLLKDSGKMRIK